MSEAVKILVVGVGNMGVSHAKAYHKMDGFEIVGLVSRTIKQRTDLPDELADYPRYENYEEALAATSPDAVSINTWPNTHADYAIKAFAAGCHVFMEKPIATNNEDANRVVEAARKTNRKLVLGYILRVHPSWMKFIEMGKTLGKPLVMRLNLNQQSSGPAWMWHKNLIDSLIPIVDCGVHYVDVMCQLTGAKPVRVHGIGAKLWDDASQQNYGHLHVTFDDGSVGWYEAGWGPMMSEVAFFVKDVVGPKGAVSIVVSQEGQGEASTEKLSDSADIDQHTKTNAIKIHHAAVDPVTKNFTKPDEIMSMSEEPGHQDLCDREQEYFLKAIREDLDLSGSMDAAVSSLRIVLAAEESIQKEMAITLD
jgi:predicted dehydrogenase